MASDVDICNLALTMIGKPGINVMTEARAEAVACRAVFPHLRRTSLQQSAWTFATRRQPLAPLTADVLYRWTHRYTRPSDALSVLRIMPLSGVGRSTPPLFPFEVRENHILTSIPSAVCDFVADIEDTTQFSPMFVEMLSLRLAGHLARNLTRSAKLSTEMDDLARQAMSRAITADAAQDAPTYLFGNNAGTPDYTDLRHQGNSW